MHLNYSIINLFVRLWTHINEVRRRQLGFLLLLILLTSFAEILSIGSVFPFLGALTSPDLIFKSPLAQPIIQYIGLTTKSELVIFLTIFFGIAIIFSGAIRLLLLWAITRFSFALGGDFSINIYRRTLYQSYEVHCSRNSSEIINGITGKANGVIYGVIIPTLTLISSFIILLIILIGLLLVEPIITLISFGGFGLIYGLIIRLTKKQLLVDSKRIANESSLVIKSLQEGLGGIRDVLIDGSQEEYCNIYSKSDKLLRRAQGNSLFISLSPRYGMEALGILFIIALSYFLTQEANGFAKAIPILGGLALCSQRLLPILQQAYAAWSNIQGSYVSLQDTLLLLDQPLPNYVGKSKNYRLPFKESINLKKISFRYRPETPYILKECNLKIPKGSRIGFIGTTGSGKSTLIDIITGLLSPTEGSIEIDGRAITSINCRAWQANIAHVPQTIFLADSTVAENIAFGVPKDQIDHQRVQQAAKQARIDDTIESWEKKYQSYVGERGIRLSGGQRQRIGIARALYKKANVIIFDEATSALDSKTEKEIMRSIDRLSKNLTLLIIAHRLSTLKNCTNIVQLNDGLISYIGTYENLTSKKT